MTNNCNSLYLSRLKKDLIYCLTHPLNGISIYLKDDNLSKWYLQIETENFGVNKFYFEINFPLNKYPRSPPILNSLTYLPHISMSQTMTPPYSVCLQLIEPFHFEEGSSKKYEYWTVGYNAYSILLQMQDFLSNEYFINASSDGILRAITETDAFQNNTLTSMNLNKIQYRQLFHELTEMPDNDHNNNNNNNNNKEISQAIINQNNNYIETTSTTQNSLWIKLQSEIPSNAKFLKDSKLFIKDSTSYLISEKQMLNAGKFGKLSSNLIVCILSYLQPAEINNTILSCTFMNNASREASLWRELLHKYYPNCKVIPNYNITGSTWKNIWLLECNRIKFYNQLCYLTKLSCNEDVLGIPLSWTINPKTKSIDYIYSTMDILSYQGFNKYGCSTSLWGESIEGWLPLYINKNHFIKALPHLEKSIKFINTLLKPKQLLNELTKSKLIKSNKEGIYIPPNSSSRSLVVQNDNNLNNIWEKCKEYQSITPICNNKSFTSSSNYNRKKIYQANRNSIISSQSSLLFSELSNRKNNTEKYIPPSVRKQMEFDPLQIINVLPRLMSTIVIMLVEGGIDEVDDALNGYCMLHRLFIALVLHYPSLKDEINNKVKDFITNESSRTKSTCHALGNFLPLLSVCTTFGWNDIVEPLMNESFSRAVLWVCRDVPELNEIGLDENHILPSNDNEMIDQQNELIDEIYISNSVSRKIYSFYSIFIKLFQNKNLNEISDIYDRNLGMPSRYMINSLTIMITKIQNIENFNDYFEIISHPKLQNHELYKMWIQSVKNSIRKGYHSIKTDFKKLQSNGVSKFLLRGKTFQRIVFAIDCSHSMICNLGSHPSKRNISRMDFAKNQLEDIIKNKLTHKQQFSIVKFNHEPNQWKDGLMQATPSNINYANKFVKTLQPGGGTNIKLALEACYNVPNVEAIYLLSDGEDGSLNKNELEEFLNRLSKNGKTPCHVTSINSNNIELSLLNKIAELTNGSYLHFNTTNINEDGPGDYIDDDDEYDNDNY
jgi:Mg-chelatase subunit ChlD